MDCFPDDWLTALWGAELPIQRCTVHKHRNLLGHAPKAMHDELTEDYRDMIYAETAAEVETRRKAFLRKWRLKCRAVADSLEGEGGPWPQWGRVSPPNGERLFAFTRLDPSQWKSARTTNAIERLNEEFRRRIKTQTVLPCAETVPMLSGPFSPQGRSACARSTDGRPCPSPSSPSPLTRRPDQAEIIMRGERRSRISTSSQTRPELLDGEMFYSLAEARIVIEGWRQHYNTQRPHSSLGYKPPVPVTLIWPTTPPEPASPATPTVALRPTMH